MKVGWNRRYILHCLVCLEWLAKTTKTLVFTGLLSSFVFAFPVSTGAGPDLVARLPKALEASHAIRIAEQTAKLDEMLSPYEVDADLRAQVIRAILASSAKYKTDPLLVASIVIVESGANAFAVSEADSVGIMQIHLGTWGETAVKENINLFRIEDNVDMGVRILRDYIAASDTWEGVARYRGKKADDPLSVQTAQEYVEKVQKIYEYVPQE
jgi:soluble lytic murein transglycosylase-like protein